MYNLFKQKSLDLQVAFGFSKVPRASWLVFTLYNCAFEVFGLNVLQTLVILKFSADFLSSFGHVPGQYLVQNTTDFFPELSNKLLSIILPFDAVFFFFHWHYSPLWGLACRTMFFHFFLSATNSLHLLTPSTCEDGESWW